MYQYVKRVLDIVIAVLSAILLSPLMAVTAIAVKAESEGPALLNKTDWVKAEKYLKYKFRSMCQGAEHTGSGVYSGADDMRVTKVGKLSEQQVLMNCRNSLI